MPKVPTFLTILLICAHLAVPPDRQRPSDLGASPVDYDTSTVTIEHQVRENSNAIEANFNVDSALAIIRRTNEAWKKQKH